MLFDRFPMRLDASERDPDDIGRFMIMGEGRSRRRELGGKVGKDVIDGIGK